MQCLNQRQRKPNYHVLLRQSCFDRDSAAEEFSVRWSVNSRTRKRPIPSLRRDRSESRPPTLTKEVMQYVYSSLNGRGQRRTDKHVRRKRSSGQRWPRCVNASPRQREGNGLQLTMNRISLPEIRLLPRMTHTTASFCYANTRPHNTHLYDTRVCRVKQNSFSLFPHG